jgi:hypothetical protein
MSSPAGVIVVFVVIIVVVGRHRTSCRRPFIGGIVVIAGYYNAVPGTCRQIVVVAGYYDAVVGSC